MRLLHSSFGIQKTGWITEEKVIQPALFFWRVLLRKDEEPSQHPSHDE